MAVNVFKKFFNQAKVKLQTVWVYFKWTPLIVYQKLHLEEAIFFILFVLHRYSAKQFSPLHVAHNLRLLARLKAGEGLSANRHGKFQIISPGFRFWLFSLWNILSGGALQSRVEKAVLYTYLTVTLELNNPFTKRVLLRFLRQKISFLERHLGYVKRVNGKLWNQAAIRTHIHVFERNSLFQAHVIETMHRVVKLQKEPEIIQEAKFALNKGLRPLLIAQGISGSYWIAGVR